MPISFRALKTAITPSRTALVLGAGASVPSGAPTGADLARRLWKKFEHSELASDDLTDTASVLVRKYGRREIVEEIVDALKRLKPTGGLLGLPTFGWPEVFTTNFDQLVENAYKHCGVHTTVYRSNYDFTAQEASGGTKIYKLHGCITQDDALGR